ncbi:TlpA disulfide reductase family protein [Geobacter sp. SVR]|uniref:TlpA disulfide reductase family protein n=1 Tax=Geobacter sp. SVR TaxID=2495594 RepID=UPI00143EFFC8|nr:TlpA disulfide reductase family protein [Geobacter sp. SVR]BCS53960.1 thioredoxin [Geobacter sp. SVR]GCF86259.1 thioredoxin [Geobacter sp. SVR]
MRRLLCLVMLLLMTAAVSLSGCTRKEQTAAKQAPSENSPAPDVQVTALDGSTLKLSDLRGKVVLLNFWATWCPPCREEIPSMMALEKSMSGKPFQMVAVSIDEGGKQAVESFFQTSGFKLPAYTDPEGKAGKIYGITGVPETFIIDKRGILVKKVIGALSWDSPEAHAFLEGLTK